MAAAVETIAAQQCGLPEGLDATDMDMIRRGDMLGPALGARAASLIQSQAARIAELEAGLMPFAQRCGEAVRLDDGDNDGVTVKTKHLRTAHAILKGERKG